MRPELFTLVCVATGAFIHWMISGFKGSFNEQMSRYHDNDSKYDKNYWTGIAIILAGVILIIKILK